MVKSLLMLAIFTAFTVFAWISLTIYHNLTTTTIAPEVESQIAPIFSTFDTKVVDLLKKRQVIDTNLSENYLSGVAPTAAPITANQPTPSIASGSATPTPRLSLTVTPTRIPTPTP